MPLTYRLNVPGTLQIVNLDTGEPITTLDDKGNPMSFTGAVVARQLIAQIQSDEGLDDFDCHKLREKIGHEGPALLTEEEKVALVKVAKKPKLALIVRASPAVVAFLLDVIDAPVSDAAAP